MHNKFKLRFIVVISTPVLVLTLCSPIATAGARDCVAAACLSVYVQDGQIVIEGRKDASVPIKPKQPRSTRKVSPSPSATRAVTPVPRRTPRILPPSIPPIIRKKIITKVVHKVVASVSLNDKLVKMLPVANISHQPASGVVVGVPVVYWCDLPAVFNSKVFIVGEVIDVTMRPTFFWSFGDGSVKLTTESGAPYPSADIVHAYSRTGFYPVVLISIWAGTWVHNGVARAITGQIRKTSVTVVQVGPAPTIFQK